MYPLDAETVSFTFNFTKAGKKFPFEIVSRIPSDADMMKYDRLASAGTYKVEQGGALVASSENAASNFEAELFEKYVVSVNGKPLSEVINKVPPSIKQAVFARGFGDAFVDNDPDREYTLDELSDNRIELKTPVNGSLVSVYHTMDEPSAEDELKYKRSSKLKTLGGRRGMQYSMSTDCNIFPSMYDRLVKQVEGYTLGGKPVSLSDDVKKLIPYTHKKAVVRNLFGAATEDLDELG